RRGRRSRRQRLRRRRPPHDARETQHQEVAVAARSLGGERGCAKLGIWKSEFGIPHANSDSKFTILDCATRSKGLRYERPPLKRDLGLPADSGPRQRAFVSRTALDCNHRFKPPPHFCHILRVQSTTEMTAEEMC